MQGTAERLFQADPEDADDFRFRRPNCGCCGTSKFPIHVHTAAGTFSVCPVCRCNSAGEV